MTLFALVDYYNVAGFRPGARLGFSDHRDAVDGILDAVLAGASGLSPSPSEFHLRFYGGWHSAATDNHTEDRELLGAVIRKAFPRRRPIRTLATVADSPLALAGEHFFHTVREWRGLPPLRFERPSTCRLPAHECAVSDLEEWRRGRCPRHGACGCKTDDIVVTIRQKLVDTSIVADLLVLASDDPESWVAAVSNDDDMVPGVIAARVFSTRSLLVRIGRRTRSVYDEMLLRNGLCPVDT